MSRVPMILPLIGYDTIR